MTEEELESKDMMSMGESAKNEHTMCKIAGVRKHADEDRIDFLKRLVLGLSQLSDKDWEKLPSKGKMWFNIAVEYVNAGRNPPETRRSMWNRPAGMPSATEYCMQMIIRYPHMGRRGLWRKINEAGYMWKWRSFIQTYNYTKQVLRCYYREIDKEEEAKAHDESR